MANQHVYEFSIQDYSEETSSSHFNFGAVTALNIAGFLSQLGSLRTAIGGVILGTIVRDQWVGDRTKYSADPPSDTHAQVELKIQVSYEGNSSHKKFRSEIPTADPSLVMTNSDKIDITTGAPAALVTAIEALVKSPDNDAEGVNVLDMRLVGRNV